MRGGGVWEKGMCAQRSVRNYQQLQVSGSACGAGEGHVTDLPRAITRHMQDNRAIRPGQRGFWKAG